MAKATVYLTLRAKPWKRWSNEKQRYEDVVRGCKVITSHQNPPVDPQGPVVKVILNVPDELFLPLEVEADVEATITIPDGTAVATLEN